MPTYEFYISEDDTVHTPGVFLATEQRPVKLLYFKGNYQLWYVPPRLVYTGAGRQNHAASELLLMHVYRPHWRYFDGESLSMGRAVVSVEPKNSWRRARAELIAKLNSLASENEYL